MSRPQNNEIRLFARDPDAFRRSLTIDARGHKKLFVPEPWQDENLKALDPLWTRVAGLHNEKLPKSAWLGRAKGHSKTTDEAMQLLWALAFSRRRVTGIAAASARNQAALIKEAVEKLILLNPWLSELIEVQGSNVNNKATGSHMDIISNEALVWHGPEPDFIICDELTHWENDSLWTTLFAGSEKRDHCLIAVMTNAGKKRTWQHAIREDARKNPSEWVYRDFDGPVASWMTSDALNRQKRGLTDKAFRRLWLNEWQDDASDELSRDDIMACVRNRMGRMSGDEEDFIFIGGLDLATKRHRSAFVVLAANPQTRRICLAHCESWKAGPSGMIDLGAVRSAIIEHNKRFKLLKVCFDPAQAILMAQDCSKAGVRMEEMNFSSPKNLSLMATTILEVFRSRQVDLYNDPDLIEDLTKLNIVEKGGLNFKIEAGEDMGGHADRAFAFAIALPAAVELSSIQFVNPFTDAHIAMTLEELQARMREQVEQTDASHDGPVAPLVEPEKPPEMALALQEAGIEWGNFPDD